MKKIEMLDNDKKQVQEWLLSILIGVAIALIIFSIFTSYVVKGSSMFPTFKEDERVYVNKLSKIMNNYKTKDIIVFHEDKNDDYIKRVIGTPNDKVVYKQDTLYVNGKQIDEPYLSSNRENKLAEYLTDDFSVKDIKGSKGQATIPKDKYLVLGDNRENSKDSRSEEVGLIDKKQIVGKVITKR